MVDLTEQEEAFQTMGEEPWEQEEESRIVGQEMLLILPTRNWTRPWTIMLVVMKNMIDESVDSS